MTLKDKINENLNDALKSGDTLRRSVLGMVKASIHNKEIEQGKQKEGLSDEEVKSVIMYEAKKRKDSIEEFKKAGREDLAKKEEDELEMLKDYLPAELSEEEVASELKKIIEGLGGATKEDFGRVMGQAMKSLKGRADGTVVRKELEKLLS